MKELTLEKLASGCIAPLSVTSVSGVDTNLMLPCRKHSRKPFLENTRRDKRGRGIQEREGKLKGRWNIVLGKLQI